MLPALRKYKGVNLLKNIGREFFTFRISDAMASTSFLETCGKDIKWMSVDLFHFLILQIKCYASEVSISCLRYTEKESVNTKSA